MREEEVRTVGTTAKRHMRVLGVKSSAWVCFGHRVAHGEKNWAGAGIPSGTLGEVAKNR